MILFVAGDVGGARAMLPVITACERRGLPFTVVEHGHLAREMEAGWARTSLPGELSPASLPPLLSSLGVSVLVFTSSVHDTVPLTLARQAKDVGVPVVHLLDNWSNYRYRLEHDHFPMLVPEIYTVMDQVAYDGALAEGIPAEILRVTGQPALADLTDEMTSCPPGRRATGPLQLIFVSEPVAADQGTDPSMTEYRGYTENTVLRLLCRALQPHADRVFLAILPHPREDRNALATCWQEVRGAVPGAILTEGAGRRQALAAEGVIGMASILLYEAWLIGLPVLSLQPGVRGDALRSLALRPGLSFVDSHEKIDETLTVWLASVRQTARVVRPDLARHREAAARIRDLIESLRAERPPINKPMEREKR